MKLKALLVLVCLAALAWLACSGCSTASKKSESLHSIQKFNPETGKLVYAETWRDRSKGGGAGLLSDPKATAIDSKNVNQNGLGGGSQLTVGDYSSTTSTEGIKATGEAVGGVINSAVTGGK